MNSDEPLTREEISEWRRKNFGRGLKLSLWAIPIGIGMGLVAPLLLFASIWIGVPPDIARTVGAPLLIPVAVVLMIWLAFRKQDDHEIMHERLMRQKMDSYQWRWRIFNIACVLITAAYTYYLTLHLPEIIANPASSSFPSIYLVLITTAAMVAWKGPAYLRPAIRKGLNDELTQEMRRKSIVAGYLCLVAMLCVAFTVALFRPELAPTMLLWLMFAGVSVPILCFAFLEWKASRS